jgi:M6 family metalloprotease-like protein
LLGLGNPAFRSANLATGFAQAQELPDTLRILAIRVEFQKDDNSLTTGDGKFDLSSSSAPGIDPPPHDRQYFEHQLLALSNYYKKVSGGKLVLEFEVFPRELSGSYTLSQQMSFYVPVESEALLDQRLSEFFQEGIQLADATGEIDFSQFDSFILFHAGVGSDFAFDFDPTPQDIPSVFLDYSTLRKFLGQSDPNYQGIPVNGGRFFIRDGIILPETQSQEGFEIGLLGTMALMFGHQLGLPNLFDTDTGRPGIGVFGLMDQGSGNFVGLLPAEPCAWSKVFLGWEKPIEIKNGENLPVAASQAANSSKIYKIPIDSKEYFLIENRQRDFGNDGVAVGRDADGNRVEFRWDEQGQRILTEGAIGVITQVSEYDFGLPGSGILIWHVDERVIERNFEANRVNADPVHRGVDLEEADGAQDIGQVYGFISRGAGSENGVIEDMYWGSNKINMLVNDSEVVAFTPATKPNSASNSGANTHIFITNFSEPDSVMTFNVSTGVSQSGFPVFTGTEQIFTNSPIVEDLNNDGQKEIVYSSRINGKIFVSNLDGTKFIPNSDSTEIEKISGKKEKFATALFAEPEGELLFSPALANFQGGMLVVAVTEQSISVYQPRDDNPNPDGRADLKFVFKSGAKFTTAPLITDFGSGLAKIVAGTENGRIISIDIENNLVFDATVSSRAIVGLAHFGLDKIAFTTENGEIGLLDQQGTLVWKSETNVFISRSPVVGDLNNDSSLNIIVAGDRGDLFVFDEAGNLLQGFPKSTGLQVSSQIALGDLDKDGFLEIVFVGKNKIYAYSHVGVLENNFPIQIGSPQTGPIDLTFSSPILADLDGDGVNEILVGSSENQLEAFHNTGERVEGFPLSTGGKVNSTAAVFDLDNDGDLEVAVASDDGFLYVWDWSGSYTPSNISWGSYLHDAQHSNANLEILRASPPGNQLMPGNLVYNYPNPTQGNQTTIRYALNASAEVNIQIYDLSGEFVTELKGTGFAQTENEVVWQLDDIESGVYLARVEARGGGKRDVAIIKIAVVK